MKKSNVKRTLSIYWHYVKLYPIFAVPILFVVPIGILLGEFAMPYFTAEAIDKLSSNSFSKNEIWPEFSMLIMAFALASLIGSLAWRLNLYCIWKLEMKVTYDLNTLCFKHLTSMSASFHANHFSGALVSQAGKFTGAYVRLADVFVFNVLTLFWSLIFTFAILGPKLPLFTAVLALLCVAYMIIALVSFKSVRHLNEKEAIAQSKISAQVADMLTNVLAVKSHSNEKSELKSFNKLNNMSLLAGTKVLRAVISRDIMFGLVISLASIFAFILLVGGQAWLNVSLGTLILATSYTGIITNRIWNFNNILRGINRAFGDSYQMTEILDEKPEVADVDLASRLRVSSGEIEFKGVSFSHKDANSDDSLFENFDLKIKPGEKIGLVGRSGSGKTTLTKLLLRFSDINDGYIKIDGQDINQVTQNSLRDAISYVPQEPLLFHRSLKENIAYGNPLADENQIVESAKKAHALEFIELLPSGFDTKVGERGVKLSGGQRQRIAIARAILKDSPILVLDEATSALDSESEQLIQDALWKLMENRTALVIAHRLSTIQKMDRIIVLDNGKIIEEGTHQQLIDNAGVYSELWAHQSGGFIED